MSIQDELIRSIELMIDKAIEGLSIQKDYASVVEEIKNGLYRVNVNGTDYWVKDGVKCTPTVGTPVYLHTPTGNMTQLYICARR